MSGGNKKPEAADIHIGRRVQERRRQLGISQEKLGEQLGITFQQVQKYEKGMNRIGAGRLFNISEVLRTPVGFFYDGFAGPAVTGLSEDGDQPPLRGSPALDPDVDQIVRHFSRIADPAVRSSIVELVRALAEQAAGAPRTGRR